MLLPNFVVKYVLGKKVFLYLKHHRDRMLVQVLDYQADSSIEEEWLVVNNHFWLDNSKVEINNIEFIPINEISYISLPLEINQIKDLSYFKKVIN